MRPDHLFLGIELGTTRVKIVLMDQNYDIVSKGSCFCENKNDNGIWVYDIDEAVSAMQQCYTDIRLEYEQKFGSTLRKISAIGVSGMMHGYLVFDKNGKQLAPFRTWRNSITYDAASELSKLFNFNIPQRWSIAHLYQAILNGEPHIKDISRLTTLSGHIHYLLTGQFVTGVCEASGIFPYDNGVSSYSQDLLDKFDSLIGPRCFPWKIRDIMPRVITAGNLAGTLTSEGAALLDVSGQLEPGIPFCAPEGDAGTGMISTNSIAPRTGSISAGTSAFSLQVLERPLSRFYPEIDVVATPSGNPVAMAHANTCTSDIDVWVRLFMDVANAMGWEFSADKLYETLFQKALEGKSDCDGMINYNYIANEPTIGVAEGMPMFLRSPNSKLTIANFMRTQLYSAISVLKIGMDMLRDNENVETDSFLGQGGYFKTKGVGQQLLADALNLPITTLDTAGEAGPWGMAVLAAFMMNNQGATLEEFLNTRVFANVESVCVYPDPAGVIGFQSYIDKYKRYLYLQQS